MMAPLPTLTLASSSPRRAALIARLGFAVRVWPSSIDEGRLAGAAPPAEQVRVLARRKAEDVAARDPGALVLGADTVVVLGDTMLGKPATPAVARAMLRRLSGRRHEVVTGVAICMPGTGVHGEPDAGLAELIAHARQELPSLVATADEQRLVLTAVVASSVLFNVLGDEQIAAYVQSGEPLDKAGAYGIQGHGRHLVAGLSGCFTNVVGLPLCVTAALLSLATGRTIGCSPDANCRIGDTERCACR